MMDKLLPCPFCPSGGDPRLHKDQYVWQDRDSVCCGECGANAFLEYWNTRNLIKEEEKYIQATALANHIMNMGDEPNMPAQRIQFMGGTWPDNERNQGGLCKESLVTVIEDFLIKAARGSDDNSRL